MDKGDTIKITKKFRDTLKDLPKRYTDLTETEKNAIEFADVLFQNELVKLHTDEKYKGV